MEDKKSVLKRYFGFETFRSGQQEIIDAILDGKNVLAVLPTGAGKSLCYQIPSLLSDNFSIVISPLIALMKDQVDSLNSREEVAAFINSTMDFNESEQVLQKIAFGKNKLLYIAPEKLESIIFAERIKSLNPSHLFVDEAHCISEWGHNFRPSYTKIKDFISYTSINKVAAFTATATPEVVKDIVTQLQFKEPQIFVRGFERDNLHLNVLFPKHKKRKCLELLRQTEGAAIIYTATRKNAEEIAEFLNLHKYECHYYHAGLQPPVRRKIQDEFSNGELNIIAATNAFGMGIDKKDIRLIIHYDTTGSVENFYQEIGRAGRDGKPSYTYLLYNDRDISIHNFFIRNSHPDKQIIQTVYKAICDYNSVAVGSKPESELIVDLEYISNYAGTKISRGLLHAALMYLERAGYISRVSEFEKKDSIHFTMEKNRLKQFVNTTNNEEFKNIILQLLREFGSALFSGSKNIQAGKLASSLSIPVSALYDKLTTLDNLGIISFQKAIDKETIQLAAPRTADDKLILNYKMINESYINAQRKLNLMTEFAYTKKCRFNFILNYFGERLDDYRCGKCDNCLAGERITDSTVEYISEIIIGTLDEAEKPLDENALINILQGNKLKNSFEKFREFGTCTNFEKEDIKIVVQELAAKQFINRTSGAKRFLDLTEKGKENLVKAGTITEEAVPVKNYEENLYLFNLLRDARKNASEKFLQTGNVICPDELLREVVEKKPVTKAGLLAILGFNNRMFNKIGNDFLEIINEFIKNNPINTYRKEDRTLPKNIHKTYELLLRKYSLQSISELRKLSEAVISMQIETILEYKPETDIDFLLEDEIFKKIKKQVEIGYNNLKDLKDKLPSSVPYSLIRIAAAKLKYTNRS